MARFTIYSPTGVALYEGTPTFTGQYMKPGLLEFREVAMPSLVDLVPGCYVDYSRTGHRYRIYTVPQLKKQARALSYGGAYVYQSVQLYDASKMLEYCPFRDLVLGDNRIHFSTQPSISTFEGCDGLARRFEACLVDQYGENSWSVRIATENENPALYDLMIEPREFTVSGVNILECLDKIYEIWPEVGWIYKVENGIDTIVIGGSGINPNEGTYAYGKGNGLTSLTRVAANAEEIANRIFAYGSSRNMLPRWYNNQNIKDAESVDIQNLMLPVDAIPSMDWNGWGLTDGERDAAKAFVEDTASIAKNGLRPATVYFDGSGEYPEIYPSVRETTIGMVRTAIGDSTAKYYPSTAIYTDADARIDKLLSAQATFDSGKAGEDGKQSTFSEYITVSRNFSDTIPADTKILVTTILTESVTFGSTDEGIHNISMPVSLSGYVEIPNITGAVISAHLHKGHPANAAVISGQVELTKDSSNPNRYNFIPVSVSGSKVNITAGTYYIVVELTATFDVTTTDTTYSYNYDGGISVSLSYYRAKTFNITLRQVGFDINAQAELGDGKTIAMRTGMCAGRSFTIKSVQYNATNDCWDLECWRSEDESLSQWFPNTDYPVRGVESNYDGDEFVLLDIAMPGIYISMAEQKLLTAANELLADTAVERWQYTPEIDAKYMVENNRTIRAGEYMSILDITSSDIGPGTLSYFRTSGGGYLLTSNGERIVVSSESGAVVTVFVDVVVINEGEALIPTYKVTLRDRKKKTWTESQSVEQSSSKSVGNITETTQSVVGGDSFFQLDENGNVTLKPQYQNLWVPGWLAAGGIGDGGGGGGGLITSVRGVADLGTSIPTESLTETFSAKAIETIWEAVLDLQQGSNVSLVNGASYSTLTVNGTSADFYTKAQVDSLMANIDLSDYVTETALETELAGYVTTAALTTALAGVNTLDTITTNQDGTVDFTWKDGNIVKVDLNHEHSNYVPKSLTINGVDLSQNRTFYVGTSPIQATAQAQNLTGILSIKAVASNTSMLVWDNDHGAWRVMGNLYADGWVAAGGIGSGNGGGGGTSSLYGLFEVDSTTTPSTNDVFYFNGTQWTNSSLKTVNNTSLLGSGNITVSGGTEVEVYNLLSTGTRVATIRIGGSSGTAYDILAPTSGGGGASSLNDLSDVTISSVANGDLLVYNSSNSQWENVAKATALTDYALKAGSFTYNFQANSIIFNGGTLTGTTTLELAHRLVFSYQEGGMSVDDPVVTVSKTIAFLDDIPAHQTVTLTGGTNNGTLKLTTAAGTVDNIAVTGLQALAYKASLVASDIPDISGTYVTISGTQTITGSKTFSTGLTTGGDIVPSADLGSSLGYSTQRFSNVNAQTIGASTLNLKNSSNGNSGMLSANGGYLVVRAGSDVTTTGSFKQLVLHETYGFYPDTTGVNLGYSGASNRWATIYGIDMDLTGNVTMASNKHIDLGPVRLEFANGALHVTTNDSTNYPNIGFYADGFVAAGGIQGSSVSYEVSSNKVVSLSSSSTDTQYPSAKCVYDIVGDVETLLAAL